MELLQLGKDLSTLSPVGLFAVFIVALLKRKLVLPRELDDRDAQIAELKKEREEFKQMTYRLLHLGEKVTSIAEESDDGSHQGTTHSSASRRGQR